MTCKQGYEVHPVTDSSVAEDHYYFCIIGSAVDASSVISHHMSYRKILRDSCSAPRRYIYTVFELK